MDFDPNEQQIDLLNGLEQLISSSDVAAPTTGTTTAWSASLDAKLEEGGYLDVVKAGLDLIDGALVVERLARLPVCVEAASSILVGPAVADSLERPLAIVSGSPLVPARFLPVARTLLVDQNGEMLAISLKGAPVEEVETLLAYPYGKLTSIAGVTVNTLNTSATDFRRRWRIAIAVEAAGLMQAALELVLDYVRTRRAFGRPLGAFQAIQHRLAMAAETAEASRWLAFQAAWADGEGEAATAAAFIQSNIPRFTTDLHQFCGAMGLTLEFPLHYWTYRLRALLGELGGSTAQSQAVVHATWSA